jgi:hypothetical protein
MVTLTVADIATDRLPPLASRTLQECEQLEDPRKRGALLRRERPYHTHIELLA